MSKWEEYRQAKKIKVDLKSIGLEGFWIEIRDPASFTLPELKKLSVITPESNPDDLKEAFPLIIIDWNLTHPETDKPLDLPSNNKKSLEVLPIDVFNQIGKAITDAMTVPEQTGT